MSLACIIIWFVYSFFYVYISDHVKRLHVFFTELLTFSTFVTKFNLIYTYI